MVLKTMGYNGAMLAGRASASARADSANAMAVPLAEPDRRCGCGKRLARMNHEASCYVCQERARSLILRAQLAPVGDTEATRADRDLRRKRRLA